MPGFRFKILGDLNQVHIILAVRWAWRTTVLAVVVKASQQDNKKRKSNDHLSRLVNVFRLRVHNKHAIYGKTPFSGKG